MLNKIDQISIEELDIINKVTTKQFVVLFDMSHSTFFIYMRIGFVYLCGSLV